MFEESNEPSHEEMVKIVRSEEVKKSLENYLKREDKSALTEKGIIKKYTIKDDTIKVTPLNSIIFDIYLNSDEELECNINISKNNNVYEVQGVSLSSKASEYIKGEYNG